MLVVVVVVLEKRNESKPQERNLWLAVEMVV